jgi:hypothetical protein
MQEYIDRYCELVEQLQSYNRYTDPLYFTTRFIDGLKDYIKLVILVQRPRDLDTTCCLALLQEESATPTYQDIKRSDIGVSSKPYTRGAYPLPRPPPQQKRDTCF